MLQEWRVRPLEAVYPFIFLDAILYIVKKDGIYISKSTNWW
jgi:transposase-like protein